MITKAGILALLETSQVAVERAILVIQARQTSDEQAAGQTKHVNGRGWSAFDAPFMGKMYDWIMVGTTPRGQQFQGKPGYGKALGTTLTVGQLAACRKVLMGIKEGKATGGYAGQLLEEAQAKAGLAPAPAPAPAPTPTEVGPMLALVLAVLHDATEGMEAPAIANYLTTHGWRVEQPQEQPQEPAPLAEEFTLDPEPEAPAAIAYAAATQPATVAEGASFEDPGF
jgi:pyruvate/2-oxoglutarate dehydrogenase complex dihydrolipoamide acyltransferase (E2) component